MILPLELLLRIWELIRYCICYLLGMPQKQRELKQTYNYSRPKRIILVRHGQSMGNVDETAYATTPDWKIPLTEKGKQQADAAGETLSSLLLPGESLSTYVSPYERTMETWQVMKQTIMDQNPSIQMVGTRQEPRIAEQQFGNFQNPHFICLAKEQRHMFGRFFYRFPNGEAGMDVYNRVTSFLSTLSRDWEQLRHHQVVDMEHCNILIVTHGLTLRLFLMRYFQLTVPEFEESLNPPNAKLIIMDRFRSENHGEYYRLDASCAELLNLKGDVSTENPVYLRERYNL
jgi:broad specificity phosphatase PhoE